MRSSQAQEPERGAALAFALPAGTLLYYLLPASSQAEPVLLFLPQAMGYLALAGWLCRNTDAARRLGLALTALPGGLCWGAPVGVLLGLGNTLIILWGIPCLGGDILFLRETPHARVPSGVMLPWGILGIALAVEVNFRGFLLGRLWTLCERTEGPVRPLLAGGLALGIGAMAFSFDPFMVATFRHLHWIAIWDGLVWGALWIRLKNLYATIVAHAVEVIIVYVALKLALP